MSARALLALLALAPLAGFVHAAPAGASVSYSTWILAPSERTVTLRFTLPKETARDLTGTAIPVITVSKVGNYILRHTAVYAAGRECPASDQGYDLGRVDPLDAGRGLYGFELVFRCDRPLAGLTLVDSALFDRDPSHVDFARIEHGRDFVEQLFTAGRERLEIADVASLESASIGRYVHLGWRHVMRSPPRLALLVVALLLLGRRRELAQLFGGLAGGYLLCLLAQATGLIAPRAPLLEALIGALVALLAVRVAIGGMDRPRILRIGWPALLLALAVAALLLRTPEAALLLAGLAVGFAGYLRLAAERRVLAVVLPAALYGLFDGFVLPALLGPLHLAAGARAPLLVGYDAGALLADGTVAAIVVAAGFLLARAGFLTAVRPALNEAAAACLAGLGTFWLIANAARTIPLLPAARPKPSIAETLAHVDQTNVNPESLLMRDYYLMGNTLVPMSEKPTD